MQAQGQEKSIMRRAHPDRTAIIACVLCAIIAAAIVRAQALPREPDQPQVFETATLKLVRAGDGGPTTISPWGSHQFHAVNVSLGNLLAMAWDIDLRYISGIPPGLEEKAYTIDAVAGGDRGLSYEQIHAPLQALLRERLHLVVRQTTQSISGYRLEVAGKGPKLTSSTADPDQARGYLLANGLKAQGMSLATFARLYASVVDRPVVDGTGITGRYDFDVHFARMEQAQTDLPSPEKALEDQYGLRLVPAKITVKALVVEHVDLQPSED